MCMQGYIKDGKCLSCNGIGIVITRSETEGGFMFGLGEPCPTCGGKDLKSKEGILIPCH